MGFIDVFVTLSAIAGYCIYQIQGDGSDASSDSKLQWDLVSRLHISESNSLFLTSSALLVFRRLALYTVIASVLSIVLDPGIYFVCVAHCLSIAYICYKYFSAGMTATVSTRDGSQKSVHLTHLSRLTTFTVRILL